MIATKHVMTMDVDPVPQYNPQFYTNGVGQPPKYRIHCTCQWEGLAHTAFVALKWINSHVAAQQARGNEIEVRIEEKQMEELRAGQVSVG